jgi:hypothetical protein
MDTVRESQVRLARYKATGELLGRVTPILDAPLGQVVRAVNHATVTAYRHIGRREAILHPAGGEFIYFPAA